MKDSASSLNGYQHSLLLGWEEVFKKGQVTLWIALALKDGPKHMAEIQEFIKRLTDGASEVDDRSVYRALRRYTSAEIVVFTMEPGSGGPERKVYRLTQNGVALLQTFCERNIVNVFYRPDVQELIKRKV